MKRKTFILLLALTGIIIVAASSFDTASARIIETFTEHMDAYGSTSISVDGLPQILIDAYHFDSGKFGSGDVLRIWCWQDTPIGPVLQNVAVFTDMPDRADFLAQMFRFTPTSIQLISSAELDVSREGNSKTVMAAWKTALQVPAETWWPGEIPAFTIPPGRLVFRGHGEDVSGTFTKAGSGGWIQTLTWTGYYGNATFICPSWRFGGPVGENGEESQTIVYTNATLVSNRIIVGL